MKLYYIDPEEFAKELLLFRKTNIASERLGLLFMTLCDKILNHKNFVHYNSQLKEDMRSFALYNLMKFAKTCNPEERTPRQCFNYCTTAIWHAYQNTLTKYYKEQNMKHAMIQAGLRAFEELFGVKLNTKDLFELYN